MRTKSAYAVSQRQCETIAAALIAHSQWFSIEPYPDDQWLVTVKEENAGLLARLIDSARV